MSLEGVEQGRCLKCGYDVSGLEPETVRVCPECGAVIDWGLVMRPREVRAAWPVVRGLLLIVAPHAATAVVVGVLWRLERYGGAPVLGSAARAVLVLDLVVSPLCMIGGVHALMGAPDRQWARLLAAIVGLGLGIFLDVPVLMALMLP